jgi:hypothetical protein
MTMRGGMRPDGMGGSPAIGSHADPHSIADAGRHAVALGAMVATGMAPWDAMTELVRNGVGPDALEAAIPGLRGVPAEALMGHGRPEALIGAIVELGRANPIVAQAALEAFLWGRCEVSFAISLNDCRWLRSLPSDFRVVGGLYIRGCRNLMSLPDGFSVPCADFAESWIVSLPSWFRVEFWLNVRDTPAWDGRVPEDAAIGDNIHTSVHPEGISLGLWRAEHPTWERG